MVHRHPSGIKYDENHVVLFAKKKKKPSLVKLGMQAPKSTALIFMGR